MRKQPSKNWLRHARCLASKGAGMWAAAMLVLLSFLMIINNFHIISFHFQRSSFVRDLEEGRVFFTSVHNTLGEHILGPEDRRDSEQMRKFLLDTRDDTLSASFLDFNNTEVLSPYLVKGSKPPVSNVSPPTLHYDPALPLNHPCQGFSIPPPPADKKRTGPRPCPVCYLPIEHAIQAMPSTEITLTPVLKNLTFLGESNSAEASLPTNPGSEFGGHPTLEDRNQSHHIREEMAVHCGFVKGSEPGVGTGFDISDEDRAEMHKCHGIVVGSAIFGNYDELQQPKNISEEAKKNVCFFMFIDEETGAALLNNENLRSTRKIGLWNMVVVRNLPYADARRNGKIPKLLIHRLFPNARFSLWVDGKLELVVDPYRILERFLWRTNDTFAISKHYARFDVFVEAEANKAAGKYDNASIDAQVDFYRSEGLTPYNSEKLPIVSDVPEGCVIIREHTPVTNLFGCLWFNEVDRFTSRDQLSFATVRDKLVAQIPWRVNMFLDCERRNFVVQGCDNAKGTTGIEKGQVGGGILISVDYSKEYPNLITSQGESGIYSTKSSKLSGYQNAYRHEPILDYEIVQSQAGFKDMVLYTSPATRATSTNHHSPIMIILQRVALLKSRESVLFPGVSLEDHFAYEQLAKFQISD